MPSGPHVPGRTWIVRVTGHADHTVSVTCSDNTCRMPARSKDVAAVRRAAAEHAALHARRAGARPEASCHCGAEQCALHEARAACSGASMLVLIHNRAVGRVWTLADVCQACAREIPHLTVLAKATTASTAPARVPGAAEATPVRPAVAGGFSSPQAASDPTPRRRPLQRRRSRG
ncbi:hypothetical protein ACN20G_29615 (plasmid) [Streptomyces sp. BI20]|uniref:hypothetical protein n=1 Tax=Streptomyces sp. BI20 TaxID=3403460 RepID=UPI003C7598C4